MDEARPGVPAMQVVPSWGFSEQVEVLARRRNELKLESWLALSQGSLAIDKLVSAGSAQVMSRRQ